eukprot:scaffold10871_cov131-Skeletonema_dohrnii-CCMP3373.AAC.1
MVGCGQSVGGMTCLYPRWPDFLRNNSSKLITFSASSLALSFTICFLCRSHSSTQNNINEWIGSSSQEIIHHCAHMGEIYFEEAEVTANYPMRPCCVGKDVAKRSNG